MYVLILILTRPFTGRWFDQYGANVIIFPAIVFLAIAIQNAEPHRHPVAMATFLSIFDLGIGSGSLLVGAVFGIISFSTLYIFSSIYVLVGLAVYYWAQKRNSSGEVQARG